MTDARRLDLNFLAVFDAIHRERSVTAASHRVGLSQPATSAALARLRRQFGDPLFVRTPGGMVPTPLAEALAPTVRELLETAHRLLHERPAADPALSEGILRIALSDASALRFLPRIAAHLQRAAPRWRLETVPLQTASMAAGLTSGELDLAIGNLVQLATPGFYRQRLDGTRYLVIHRRDHPRLRTAPSLRDYLAEAHAQAWTPGAAPSVLEQWLSARGHVRRIALWVPQFLLLPAVVAETDLLATVPAHVAESLADAYRLAVWPLPVKAPELVLHQGWHARLHRDPASRWLRAAIREALRPDAGR